MISRLNDRLMRHDALSLATGVLAFLGGIGFAIDSSGGLFFENSDSGYPLAVFILPLHLLMNLAIATRNGWHYYFDKIEYFFVGWIFVILIFAFCLYTLSIFVLNNVDATNFITHAGWIVALLNGMLIGMTRRTKGFLSGSFAALVFLLLYNCLDIAKEAFDCGILLCGVGRTSSSAGLPGLYQQYIYMPTLICALLAARFQVLGVSKKLLFASFVVIISTGSREGFLLWACSILLPVVFADAKVFFKHFSRWATAIFVLLLMFPNIGSVDFGEVAIVDKFAAIDQQFEGDNSRVDIIEQHMPIFVESPFFGNYMVHPSSEHSIRFVDQPSAHNGYVDELVTGGVFYFVLMVFVLSALCIQLFNSCYFNSCRLYFPIFFGCFLLISMMINVPLRAPLLIYSLFGLIGVYAFRYPRFSGCVGVN